jgi:hypothetical protein
VIYLCRAVEFIGLGHFSWLLYYLFSFNLDSSVNDLLGNPNQSDNNSDDINQPKAVTKAEWKQLEQKLETQDQKLDLLINAVEALKATAYQSPSSSSQQQQQQQPAATSTTISSIN